MLKNYLKVFQRQLLSNKVYFLINVLGLAAGLVCCIFIMLFVRHELGYDAFFSNADNKYRISVRATSPDGAELVFSTNIAPVAPLLQENISGISDTTRVATREVLLSREELAFYESGFRLVDVNFLSFFDFDWLAGAPEQAFSEPNAVVLTESLARKYFGTIDVVGETLLMDSRQNLVVSGVIVDMPTNTHLTGSIFASFALLDSLMPDAGAFLDNWGNIGLYTYVELEPGIPISEVANQLPAFIEQHGRIPPGLTASMQTMALTDIHMQSRGMNELKPGGNMSIVFSFSAIGLGILLIACINFINISTARASRRALEVGVRKSLGAGRWQLARQFMGESAALCFLAMLVAAIGVELLMPTIAGLLGMNLSAELFSVPVLALVLPLAALLLGLLAGWYPALFLSAFQPSQVLKGTRIKGQAGKALRNLLVIAQFSIAIILLVSSIVIQTQLRHANEMDMGFDREMIVVVSAPVRGFDDRYGAFRNMVLEHEAVLGISAARSSPLRETNVRISAFSVAGNETERTLPAMQVDTDYFALYDIGLVAGRVFSAAFTTDRMSTTDAGTTGALVINERAAREFGWTAETAIGQLVETQGNSYPVIGVVANTIENARTEANPVIYSMADVPMAGPELSIKVRGDSIGAALVHIDAAWQAVSPDEPIQRAFLNDTFNGLYLQDTRQMELSFFFSMLAIVIACMGLYGLAAFSTESRTKEIGVRKVMGGSVWSIVLLLTNDFSKLVLISNLIAWPVAYITMVRWLENFAYRIDLTPLIFISSGLIALCIAWVTVGGTAAKAASAKPILALRYE